MLLLDSRVIRWHVTKFVESIEKAPAEREAGQQLFIAWEAEQSIQHEPIISATFHGNLCHPIFTVAHGTDLFIASAW